MASFRIKSLLCFLLLFQIGMAAEELYPLRRLIIADSEEAVLAIPQSAATDGGMYVQGVPLLADTGFQPKVKTFFGQPIGKEILTGLGNAIVEHARSQDRLIARVLVPVQPVADGTLRLVVVIGRYHQLSFQGNRRFSQQLLEKRLGIKPGDEVRLSTLEDAVNWVNTNPFRQVKVQINDLPNQPGKADLVVAVDEKRPYRLAVSVDNTGTEVIGKRRIAANVQFGNLWDQDHQGSYQFLTTDKPEVYQGHAVNYRVPLPWRHFAEFSGIYATVAPSFEAGLFDFKGETIVADAKYVIPLKGGNEPRDLAFGTNFKQSNNDLEYGGVQVRNTSTNTFQAYASFSLLERDKRGAWLLAAAVNASPGGVNSRNNEAPLQQARFGASPKYVYGTLSLQRLLQLGRGWDLFSRAVGQLSSTNLLANEQLNIGGQGTVRGYKDNTFSGDRGFVLSSELMSPMMLYFPTFLKNKASRPVEGRLIAFVDAGKVAYHSRIPSDLNLSTMASVGVGARLNLGSNFSFSFDYGWQLRPIGRQPGQAQAQPLSSRGHVKAVLAF